MIAGLGNPGKEYEFTRHNAGWWWVNNLAENYAATFKENTKLKGWLPKTIIEEQECLLFKPSSYMNESGLSIRLVSEYYQIPLDKILVVHDEMAFSPGTVKIKFGGGANGHNGLKSLFTELSNNQGFYRLRIGVGHPGQTHMVTPYLTKQKIPVEERKLINDSLNFSSELLREIVNGCWNEAMNKLHAQRSIDENLS